VSKRVCTTSGCPALIPQGATRCPVCASDYERARGSSTQRGYDAAFNTAKRQPKYVNATHCTECGCAFASDNPKTAGHVVAIRKGGQGSGITPQCRRCNYGWLRTGT